ncbi:MAG: membrane protease subunit HflK [Phycisphaerales bacterium]|jgi:membrane protease subunit HflK
MNADYLTYRKATKTSLLGLFIQTGFAIALAIYARYSGGDLAAMSAAIAVGTGSLVWFALLILHDQHRRERIEAMEADSLAATESVASSAFDASNAELRPAAQRLELIVKWFIPGMSLLVGALLLGIGYLRLAGGSGSALAHYSPDDFASPAFEVFGGGMGLVLAVVGFVFARFVSGMSKEPAWAALRGGAAQAVGAALLGLLLMISLFVLSAKGPDWPHRLLQVVIPAAMMVGGIEIFILFVLDVYRPRAPGEIMRPSFDSRILGFVAAPDKIAESIGDAINYQFGVDVTSSWFFQMLRKWAAWLLLFGVLTGWLMSTLVVIQPHQRAMILTFGKVADAQVEPGLHLKWPWPIGQVITPEHVVAVGENDSRTVSTTTGVQVMHLGTNPPDDDSGPILWTTQHAAMEKLHVVQPGRAGRDNELPGELSMVAIEVPVHYTISNVELYTLIASPGQQQDLLESMGQAVVTRHVSTLSVDDVISTARSSLAGNLRAELETAYGTLNDGRGAGIKLVFVGVAGVHPPRDVAPAFEGVVQAQQVREKTIENARGYEIRVLTEAAGSVELSRQIVSQLDAIDALRTSGGTPGEIAQAELAVQKLLEQAGGDAGRQLLAASSQRWAVHMRERGKAALFAGQLAAYDAAPMLYRSKAYFDALRVAMSGQRVYLTDEGVPMETVIDLNDRLSGRDVFSTGTANE